MRTIYTFLAEGFEEIECLSVVDLLRRANFDVSMISITGQKYVTGSKRITVEADRLFEEIDYKKADLLFLPGGMPGTKHLNEHSGLKEALLYFYTNQKPIAAICAAPSVLGSYGILNGKKAVCYPGWEDKLTGASVLYDKVVTDGTITTARSAGCSLDLGLELIRILGGKGLSEEIRTSILYSPA